MSAASLGERPGRKHPMSGDTVLVRGVARVACKPVQWTGENDERRELGRAARREWKP
jgi:hypothetical protein